ncbi:chemotaxis protein CheA [Mesorhizobium sp. 1B3]|uniref:chemotaxis protein CheA n=1 Tax=Mesorhizobium sp. 1B3 TaxID=3243599 RepID=UPI003D98FBF6
MDTMAAIRQTFFQECEEQLAELESGLLAIERQESDSETINAVFRAVHSIKGGAGAFGLDELVRFAHTFETTLDLMRSNALEITGNLVKLMLRSADGLADLVRFSRDGTDLDRARIAQLHAELTSAASGDAAPTIEAAPAPAAADESNGPDENGFTPIRFSLEDLVATELDTPMEETTRGPLVVSFRPKPELYAKANDALVLLREVRRLGDVSISCDISEVPLLTELDPEGAYLSWKVELDPAIEENAVREVFEFVTFDCDLDISVKAAFSSQDTEAADFQVIPVADIATMLAESPAPAETAPITPPQPEREMTPTETLIKAGTAQAAPQSAQQTTIRVDLDRVDRLIDLVGELVINQSMLAQRVTEAGIARLSEVAVGLDDLEHLTREIQDSVMAIRAQPVRPIFQRMSRVVREVADMTGKSVRLVTEGENCEVDKTVIERLADPLTHMIRNAIDHGLEKPEDRLAAGKSEQGLVRMTAAHRSGRVIIEVSDDGAGINRARVRQIAVDKSLIDPNAQLSDGEIDDLIFAPGFSTASTISDVSGRGVGMDVVKRSIQALGGRISISSRPGHGTTFTLSLPLTLAVLDGMVVTVAGQTLVVPLTAIVETLQPKEQDVHGLGETSRVVAIRGSFIPLIDIGLQLGYREEEADPFNSVAIMVESENRTQSALLVDGIIGQQQVVIKSLETNYGHVFGVAAATILGDGRVAVILDVDAIVAGTRSEMNRSDNRKRSAA